MNKPTQVKPGLYCLFYEYLKQIAQQYGYNLIVHGSLQRDLDLIAIPWTDNCSFKKEQLMIQEFEKYLTGYQSDKPSFTTLPGKRNAYVINLNRGDKHGEWMRFEDKEYYLDISVVAGCYNKE